jgi:hypothetical protein
MADATARFVRVVPPTPNVQELYNELKARTWQAECEHAVVEIEDGRWVLVAGSRTEIELEQAVPNDPFGRHFPSVYVTIEGAWVRVVRLIVHTHPKPTGPSAADQRVLRILSQADSLLVELGGDPDGTLFKPKE